MTLELVPTMISIIGMFLTIMLLDYIWLGIITKNFLIKQFGTLVRVENGSLKINLVAGVVTWFVIAVGCFIFAVNTATTLIGASVLGATFGLITYIIYDLTNLTFIIGYPKKFVAVDIIWGTILCATISTVGFILFNI